MADMDQELKELIIERLFLELSPEDIDSETPLSEYGVDSFLLLELIVAIEEMYGVQFEQSDINADTLRSIATLRELINSKNAGA